MDDKEKNSGRKPYEKPAVVSERVFETSALGCGKCDNPASISVGGACTRGKPSAS